MSTALTLQSPDLTKWDITVSTAGVLSVSSDSSAVVTPIVLASPDLTKWDVTVGDTGILSVTSGSASSAARAVLTDDDDIYWEITAGDTGILTVTETDDGPDDGVPKETRFPRLTSAVMEIL